MWRMNQNGVDFILREPPITNINGGHTPSIFPAVHDTNGLTVIILSPVESNERQNTGAR